MYKRTMEWHSDVKQKTKNDKGVQKNEHTEIFKCNGKCIQLKYLRRFFKLIAINQWLTMEQCCSNEIDEKQRGANKQITKRIWPSFEILLFPILKLPLCRVFLIFQQCFFCFYRQFQLFISIQLETIFVCCLKVFVFFFSSFSSSKLHLLE